MEWIDVKTKLPKMHEEVLVWVKFDGDSEFDWSEAWLDNQNTQKSKFSYKEPITNKYWQLGSAKNYVITHWMGITPPKN